MFAAVRSDQAERVLAALPAAAKPPAEFHDPVAYYDRWLWLALIALLVVIAYYVVVLVATRAPRTQPAEHERWQPPPEPVNQQHRHLAEIDRIEHQVRCGNIDLRDAHQQLSEVVRSYVDTVTPLPATTMSLADLKTAAPGELARAIEIMYPPEFAPDDEGQASERFDAAVHHSRRLVATWR